MSCLPSKEIPILTRLGDFIWRQPILTVKTSTKHSRAGQLEWMMLCSEASGRSTTTSASFLSSGSRSICTRSFGRWHRAKVAVWREEENREMDNGGVGTNSWYVRGNGRTQTAGVFRIQGMSAKHPPCRVWRGIERGPAGEWRRWLRGDQIQEGQISDDSRD